MSKTVGYIDQYGKYHKGEEDVPMPNDVDKQYKSWSHADQRKRFSKDILQPYVNGKPNREFIQAYDGDIAERYFSKEVISKAERSLSE